MCMKAKPDFHGLVMLAVIDGGGWAWREVN